MPQFSIILPVRNGSNYIRECIDSILSQTYTSFELLILENASTDNTVEIINSFGDERIKIIPAERPLTIEENWARAVEIPKAEYMTLIGHDDILQPNFLEIINGLIKTHPDATLYHTHFSFIDSKGKYIRDCKPMKQVQTPKEVILNYIGIKADLMGTGFIMRSAQYEEVGGIPLYKNLLFADMELVIELSLLGYFAVSSFKCFSYRLHENATTSSSSLDRYIEGFDRLITYLKNLKLKYQDLKNSIEISSKTLLNKCGEYIIIKMIETTKPGENNLRVENFINYLEKQSFLLCPDNYSPRNNCKIQIANIIQKHQILHTFFLKVRNKNPFKG